MRSDTPPKRMGSRSAPRGRSLQEQRAESARFRRSLTLVALNTLAPGTAQVMVGNREIGKFALRSWAGLVVVVSLVLWLVSMDTLAELAVRPWLLNTFELFAFGIALGWIALLIDAWRLGQPPQLNQKHRLIVLGATLALAGLVATPFVVAARYAAAAHDAVVAMFPSGNVAAASDGRLNILLLGADAGKGREGLRPDSINLVSIDVRSGRPVIVSLPRNLEGARFAEDTPAAREFPQGFTGDGDRSDWMLNGTWTYGEDHPDLFPGPAGPGPTAVMQAVEGTLDVPVHYYVVIDLRGFQELVDALGGVTVRVDRELPIGEGGRVLEPGLRTLDGYETLWYARSRTGGTDYDRMARQRCLLGAMLRELNPTTVLQHFRELADASASVVTTNIPHEQLPDLVDMAWKAKDLPITSLQLVPPLIVPADPDLDVIRDEMSAAFEESETAEPPATSDQSEAERSDEAPPPADTAGSDGPDGPDGSDGSGSATSADVAAGSFHDAGATGGVSEPISPLEPSAELREVCAQG